MSSEPAISVHNLSKVYSLGRSGRTDSLLKVFERRIRHPFKGRGAKREIFHALDDVSFDVDRGDAVGVIGKNGAGKSTLLKILSRITPPTSGYAEVGGAVGSLLEVGTGFHPELTGLENVYLNGTILGMSRAGIDRRLEEIVEFSEVQRFLETPVKRYSSGMRVRLAFAVAAHLDPEILLVDEVLSVGDAGFQSKCLAKMKSIAANDGRTVLYVSHNLVTLEYLCPRTVLLVDGRVAFDGPTGDAIGQYMTTVPHGLRGTDAGVFDLAGADRSTTKFAHLLRRLVLRPEGGPPAEQARMGQWLRMEIEVQGLSEIPDADLVVSVISPTNQQLVCMTSSMQPLVRLHEPKDREIVVLDIPALPLTPGEYSIDLRISGKKEHGQRANLDSIVRAGEFSVMPSDVLGTGYRYTSTNNGYFVTPWEWEVRPLDEGMAATSSHPGVAQQFSFDES